LNWKILCKFFILLLFVLLNACGENQSQGSQVSDINRPKSTIKPFFYVVNTNLSPKTLGSANRIASAVRRLTGVPVKIEHFKNVTLEKVIELAPVGILLSGQGAPWDEYKLEDLRGIHRTIRETQIPILGICGGHQLIVLAEGGRVNRIKRLKPGKGYKGCLKEYGYSDVTIHKSDMLFKNKNEKVHVFQSHYDEVKEIPSNYRNLASSKICKVQAIAHKSRPVWGVQFHPEKWDKNNLDGKYILNNFLKYCLSLHKHETSIPQLDKQSSTNHLIDVSYLTNGSERVKVSFLKKPEYSVEWNGNKFIIRVKNCDIGKLDGIINPTKYLKRVQWAQHDNSEVWVVLEFASQPEIYRKVDGNTLVFKWKQKHEESLQTELEWNVYPLPASVKNKMKKSSSWRPGCPVPLEDLRYLRLTYLGYDNKFHKGEMVVHSQVAHEVTAIFKELYEREFPIEKMKLIDSYNGSDGKSMADNNTSAFNCRNVAGTNKLSKHAYGLAIDINPVVNPYVRGSKVSPSKGRAYLDRKLGSPGMIIRNGPCYSSFVSRGWTWGGNWNSVKDYQHFQKSLGK